MEAIKPLEKRILLVDDDPSVLALQKRIFTGFLKVPPESIDTAGNGMVALRMIEGFYQNAGGVYHFMISDNNMPAMSGPELYRKLKGQNFRPKEILFSSGKMDDLKANLGNDFEEFSGKIIQKPYDCPEFVAFVSKYL